MKIHFMKDDALIYFKGNVDANLQNYLSNDNSWIYERYAMYKGEGESPFAEFKFEVPDFQMDMSSEKPENTDYNNVQILYTALKDISDTQASDERFWVGLAHSELWKYMQYRCKLKTDDIVANKIERNYFFSLGNKRSLIVHPLARMWWVGRLIYDSHKKDHFSGLEYMKIDFSTKVLSLFSSNFTNNPNITRSILNAILEIELNGEKVSRSAYLEIIRYVNLLGGIIILDYLSEEELKEKIINHYCEVHNISFNFKNEETASTIEYIVDNSQVPYNYKKDGIIAEQFVAAHV